jgi:uncharacterized Rmd1/YagE family protein
MTNMNVKMKTKNENDYRMKTLMKGLEKQKQIDDVYDEKAVIKEHTLYTLRKDAIIDYHTFINFEYGFDVCTCEKE